MPETNLTWSLPDALAARVRERMTDMRAHGVVRRIWDRDASVWTGTDESKWRGWLTLPMQERAAIARVTRFAAEIKAEGVEDVVLLGMGGSSMAPEVIQA